MSPRNPQQHLQQQMQDQQRRMQAAYWAKQQEDLERQRQQQREEEETQSRFRRVEREAARLRAEFQGQRLSEEDLKAGLRELMVQAQDGAWWMVDSRSGRWFRHDGGAWRQDDPYASSSTQAPALTSLAPRPRRLRAVVRLVAGLALTFALGYVAGTLVFSAARDNLAATLAASVVWLFGLVRTFGSVRRRWRGY